MSLATDRLEVRYGELLAVRSVSLDLAPGELIGLIGPNGAGKTSLLKALAGIPSASERVRWQNRPLTGFDDDERARTLAYLPQVPQVGWPLAVDELVALGRLPHRRFGQRPRQRDAAAINEAMTRTDIAPLAARRVDTLSGGELMRVHLARAFAVDAPVLLVDEPVASLDPYHQLNVMRILNEYCRAGRLVVAVLHDLNLALGFCSRLLLMDAGRIAADGTPRSVVNSQTLAQHYRIRAWLSEHAGRPVAVPWETLDPND